MMDSHTGPWASGFVASAWDRVRSSSWAALLGSAARRAVKVQHMCVFAIDAPEEIISIRPKMEVDISPVCEANVDDVADLRGQAVAGSFHRFLREGIGVYARARGGVIGHAWATVCLGYREASHTCVELHRGEALIHYTHVDAACRGKNVYPAMLAALCTALFADRRIHRVMIDTDQTNIASIRGLTKAGFRPLKRTFCVQVLRYLVFKWHVHEKVCP